ncbi:MAG: hypothetical protein IJW28_02930 [Clostridia bacterium]|nr:hypothetical protein [Clostridia bacterium]
MSKKRVLSIILGSIIGATALFGETLVINSMFNTVKGTNAAKLLLARDRMDANDTSFSWNEIVSNAAISNSVNAKDLESAISNAIKAENLGELLQDTPAGKVYKNGTNYIFKDISGASGDGNVISSRLRGVEFDAERSAKIINYLKHDLNIVNKWVKDGYNKYYLMVKDNSEILINYYEDDVGVTSLRVIERETLSNTKCVYTMYSSDPTSEKYNPSSSVYVPGERYEYYYEHGGNGADYVIAEKEKGFWNIFQPDSSKYYNTMVSDNFALYTTHNYDNLEAKSFSIANTNLKEDIISIGTSSFTLGLSAFNGIKHITADEDIVLENEHYGDIGYDTINHGDDISFTLNDGTTLKKGDSFIYNGTTLTLGTFYIQYFRNPGYADPQYVAKLSVSLSNEKTTDEVIDLMNAFLSDHNITCKYDISNIKGFIAKNKDVANNMPSYYTWNGYSVGSVENFNKGAEALHKSWQKMEAYYTAVKDLPVENISLYSPKISSFTKFASINNVDIVSPTYNDGVISIENASITVKGNELLEKGKSYALKIGLARIDANNNFISKNTIELKTTDTVSPIAYNGGSILLSASANYVLPELLEEGRYAIVVYAATHDEGIRVSQMKAIAFATTEDDTIENVYYKIEVTQNSDQTLTVVSTPKLSLNASIGYKDSYTYTDIRQVLVRKLLGVGFPLNNAEIQLADGTIVTDSDTITHGTTYRMKFKIETESGVVDAYVYCTTPTSE